MNRFLHKSACAALLGLSLTATSCSMMEDKVDECPTGLFVRYVYDYNIQRADMFSYHVGYVTLYVYDENGNKVTERSVSNDSQERPLAAYGYATHFNPDELAPGRYRLQAVAMQTDWDASMLTNRAKYRRTEGHSSAEDFFITLEHSEQPDPSHGRHNVAHAGLPLDTLWHTLKVMSTEPMATHAVPDLHETGRPFSVYPIEDQFVTIEEGRATYATVSLIRDTKHLNITLRQIDDPTAMQHADYDITIDDDNSLLGHDNSVVPNRPLRYTPFAAWTTRFSNSGVEYESGDLQTAFRSGAHIASRAEGDADVTQRTAHYNVMYNRLIHHSDDTKCAILRIRNKQTGKEVAKINLPYILAEGRTAYQTQAYSPQEYLDREHEYHLEFLLKGDTWESCSVMIDVLSWSVRFQKSDLE